MKRLYFIPLLLIALTLIFGCAGTPKTTERYVKPVPTNPNFHIFIAFGQSNMQGPGAIEAADREDVCKRFLVLNVLPGVFAGTHRSAGNWYKAVPPLIKFN